MWDQIHGDTHAIGQCSTITEVWDQIHGDTYAIGQCSTITELDCIYLLKFTLDKHIKIIQINVMLCNVSINKHTINV